MTTYYVQIISILHADRWHTCYRVNDRSIAIFVAEELDRSPSSGADIPARGVREARFISESALLREGGDEAIRQAGRDLDLGWKDFPRCRTGDGAEVPLPQFEYESIRREIRRLLQRYEEERKRLGESRSDFFLQGMPDALLARIEEAAAREGVSVSGWIVRACAKALEPESPHSEAA